MTALVNGAASVDGVTPTLTYYAGTGTGGTNLGSIAPTNAGTYTVVATMQVRRSTPAVAQRRPPSLSRQSVDGNDYGTDKVYDATTA